MWMVTLALCYVQPTEPSPAGLLSRGYRREWEQALPSVKQLLKVQSARWVDTVLLCCLLLPRGWDPSLSSPVSGTRFFLLWKDFLGFFYSLAQIISCTLPIFHLRMSFYCAFRPTFSVGEYLPVPHPCLHPMVLIVIISRLCWITCSFYQNSGGPFPPWLPKPTLSLGLTLLS